ncbi:histone-lysine N-methyltransferase SETDB1-B [Oryzias melastigma]|uniref:histone-lysine N-methyltransferase SETDB1-B n=1 Tax=Oryzias melastigma TaxID=30732 RepID=UPI000CF7D068|nr:histone-lysine N-methyltransferase SETDB1-B [Oryzias melastigma]
MEVEEFKPSMQELKSSEVSVENDNAAMEVDEVKSNMLDLESSEDGKSHENGSVPKISYEFPSSQYATPSQPACVQNGADCLHLQKEAVVVLTRLPEHVISALQSPKTEEVYSDAESWMEAESDTLWEPGDDSDDSDAPRSNNNRKILKVKKSGTSEKPKRAVSSNSTSSEFVIVDESKTSVPEPKSSVPEPKSSVPESKSIVPEPKSSVPEPQKSKDGVDNNNVSSAANAGTSIISTFMGHCNEETKNVRPNLPEKEVSPGMMIIARRRAMEWKRGKIAEIITKEDGRLKYKVVFEEKGKSLVSGHHIAFDFTTRLVELYIGARVVVQSQEDELCFLPGVLGELPNRKNRLRFLVFIDDHTPVYVGLPSLHLVCRPLDNVLDDLPSGIHKYFIAQYLKRWPYPHLTRYKVGQTITVDVNGVPEKCDVHSVDCSLILVVYQHNQMREWIHRGSVRLEHIFKLLKMDEQTKLSTEGVPKTNS